MPEKPVRKKVAKKTTRKNVSKKSSASTVSTTTRKAPTPIATNVAKKRRSTKAIFIGLFIYVLFLSTSLVIGYTDKGGIVVADAVRERRANATDEEKAQIDSVKLQPKKSVPFGGLTATNQAPPPPPPPPPETSSTSPQSTTTSDSENIDNESPEATDNIESDSDSSEETAEIIPE